MADIEKRHGAVTAKDEKINVSPTLFIGLGGSGKEVLMRLRRLFYTNMRETGLPIHEYLWIDTDPRRQDIRGQNYDEILSELYLPNTDIIDAQVPPARILSYFERPAAHKHIFDWLHPSIKNLGPNMLQNGAGMVRPCGRLAFFHHFKTIEQTLRNKLGGLHNRPRIDRTNKMGFNVDQTTTNVMLIASIAGGTGAGMLLDAAFVLKEIESVMQGVNLNITGIIFLPSVFNSVLDGKQRDVVYSNGYAFLMELDYYMSPKVGINLGGELYEKLTFHWDGKAHALAASPFHTLYLLGAKNSANVQLGDNNTDIFQMAADSIHLEFCNSQFGAEKRSIRVNLQDFLMDETRYDEKDDDGSLIYSQYFPNRYSSFGLSFIKLDIDRKRNAAAYFLGKSLVDFWLASHEDLDGASDDVVAAMKLEGLDGKKLGADAIWQFIMTDPDGEHLLKPDDDAITRGFDRIIDRVKSFFDRGTGMGMEVANKKLRPLVEKIREEPDVSKWWIDVSRWDEEIRDDEQEDILTTLARAVEGWRANVRAGEERLRTNGPDAKVINHNTTGLFTKIKADFYTMFFDLLSRPGDGAAKAGVGQARFFCERYTDEINKIISHLSSTPLDPLEFILDPIEEDRRLRESKAYKMEAERIRAPLFRKTSSSHYKQMYHAGLKRHLGDAKATVIRKTNHVRNNLLKWREEKYKNFVHEKAAHILNQMIEEIERLVRKLDDFRNALLTLGAKQTALFDAYNEDQRDVRYHHINQASDDQWFMGCVKKALEALHANGPAMSWPNFLDAETDEFLSRLREEVKPGDSPIRQWGFRFCFHTFIKHTEQEKEWKFIKNRMENYCFERMNDFLGDTDADREFQGSSVDKQQELENVCQTSDVWITTASLTIEPEKKDYIGVPTLGSATSEKVQSGIPGYGAAQEIVHEKGNLVFYKERVAFPLFYLKELEEYRGKYSDMAMDLQGIYKRHLDYHVMSKLRPISPPGSQIRAREFFDTGVIVLEALLLDCFRFGSREPGEVDKFWLKAPRYMGNKVITLGVNLNNTIEILRAAPEWTDILKEKVDERKREIMSRDEQFLNRMYIVIEYYRDIVYPTLERAGMGGNVSFESNCGLICKRLGEHYLDQCVRKGSYKDKKDKELWNAIKGIELDDISKTIPFEDFEARAPLRILNLREER